MQIQTNKSTRFNETLNTGVGEITWDEKGFSEVTEEVAEYLLKTDPSVSLVEGEKMEDPSKVNDNVGDDEIKKAMNKMLVPELQQLCVDKELDPTEWKKLGKEKLIEYLLDK